MTHLGFLKISRRLKLLELAPGFIGCFIFSFCILFCLFLLDYRIVNTLHGKSLFWTWFKSNGSSSESEIAGFLESGGEGCDISEGNWVWNASYPLIDLKIACSCNEGFRCSENGRPDNFYTKWSWQPKGCTLPRFNAPNMLEKLRDQSLVFVGDSIEEINGSPFSACYHEVNNGPITKHSSSLVFKFSDFNCTQLSTIYRAPFLVLQSRRATSVPENVKLTSKMDVMDWSSVQ